MAAILEPRRYPTAAPQARPDLRLLPGGRSERPVAPPAVRPASVVAFVAIALLVMLGAVAVGRGALAGLAPAPPAASGAPAAGAPTVTVRNGDTLWSIARRLRPSGDIRSLVDQLAAANGGTAIAAGDRLVVPS